MSTYFFILYYLLSVATCFINNVPPQYNVSYFKKDIYDPNRPYHRIPLKMYYPQTSQTDTVTFPVLIFGHCLLEGLNIPPNEYNYIWQSLVPQGYIVAMPWSADIGTDLPFAFDMMYSLNWLMDNCTTSDSCPLSKIIGTKAAVAGHSMGGGSAIICMGNDWEFNHEFDSMVTLSGCGGNVTYTAAKNISKPVMFLDGNHDCMCPPSKFADIYYSDITDDGTCKYETLITNGTHCNFSELGIAEEASCITLETEDCPNKQMGDHISVKQQNDIAVKYLAAFMNATLNYDNKFDSLNQMIQNDLKDSVLFSSVANHCN